MYVFIKFGKKEFMKDLYENGTIFCNPIVEFSRSSDGGRNDEDETTTRIEDLSGKVIQFSRDSSFKGSFYIHCKTVCYKESNEDMRGNIYCLYSLDLENAPIGNVFSVDPKVPKELGDFFVFIHNTKEFTKRVAQKLTQSKLRYYSKRIEYKPLKSHTGNKDIFTKDNVYSYQNEFRLYIDTGLNEAYPINIGSLKDIASIHRYDPRIRWIKRNSSNLIDTNMFEFLVD